MQRISVAIKSFRRENVKRSKCINFACRSQWAIVFVVVLPLWLPTYVYIYLPTTQVLWNRKSTESRPVIETHVRRDDVFCVKPNVWHAARFVCMSLYVLCSLEFIYLLCFFFFFFYFRNYLIEILLFWFSFCFMYSAQQLLPRLLSMCVCVFVWIGCFMLAQFL